MVPETQSKNGRCLCGSVEINAQTVNNDIGACHCDTCRTWGGGPLMALDCGTEVTLKGDDHITVFNSSDWAERGFCRQCGTHLFYRLKESRQYFMPMGLFGDEGSLHFSHQIFMDQKPSCYDFANETHNMTGEEFFKQFS